ncbi:MAG TPA: phosphonoacetaldehyde reductase [Rhodothermia bacterium]|nr:phosphonoacetaldehyde reductase [Rhodothermia bacterium]
MFYNPVRIHFGSADLSELPRLVGSRSATLITTPGMETRGIVDNVKRALAPRGIRVFTGVQPNPTIASITRAGRDILDSSPDVLLAIGGGSTIDTAKGVAAVASRGCSEGEWLATHLRSNTPFPEDFAPLPVIAVPTTAGTGSEVTMWGTVWDELDGSKHSISHRRLFPEAALLVPSLTVSSPRELTLFSALDTISHCMESIWNRGATPVSDVCAVAGLRKSFSSLDRVLANPDDLEWRRTLQEAALLGGLAICSNATAVAHSMSYPLTSHCGMPHGLACSFTLPEVIRFNGEHAPERVQLIGDTLGATGVDESARRLEELFRRWGVPEHVRKYITRESAAALKDRLLTPGRANNNIRPVTTDDALGMINRSLH